MNEILALYEQEQRKNVHYYGMRTEQTLDVVRIVDGMEDGEGAVVYSRLDASNADRVIREQIAYFEGIGQDFEWKVFDYDTPADLRERLIGFGFECEEPETIMVLDVEGAPAALLQPVTAEVWQITNPVYMSQVVGILDEVWDDDHAFLGQILTEELIHNHISLYIAYVDGVPASTAWTRFHEGSQFASLWGGSSLEAYRRRGLYTALLAVRVQEARRRGIHYLTIDASPMSQPIAAKHGFQPLAVAHACKWVVK
jgi:GNAT superfamily N-acetyltransferase